MWNSLEVAKLIVAALAPVSIVMLGFFVNRRIKDLERIEWSNRKAIEKRLELFDRLAPEINRLYCYLNWIGDWQEMTPADVVALKRRLDKGFFVYRYLIGEDVFHAFQSFMELAFRTYVAAGQNALIRSTLASPLGDRRKSRHFEWRDEWDGAFDVENVPDPQAVHDAYVRLMLTFKVSIGL
jgi:hypothetical protein